MNPVSSIWLSPLDETLALKQMVVGQKQRSAMQSKRTDQKVKDVGRPSESGGVSNVRACRQPFTCF